MPTVGLFFTPSRNAPAADRRRGFTLVELLVSMVVLLIILVLMVGLINQTNQIWQKNRSRVEAFQAARSVYDRLTTNLSQATLNTYLDYYQGSNSRSDLFRKAQAANPNATPPPFQPSTYDRASDLQFVCGQAAPAGQPPAALIPASGAAGIRPTHAVFFQAPLGHVSNPTAATNDFKNLDEVLNAVGYYIEFASDKNYFPKFITTPTLSYRYRLMELNQPSQNLGVYFPTAAYDNPGAWFSLAVPDPSAPPAADAAVLPLAENIVALVLRPKISNPIPGATPPVEIAPSYTYDTKGYLHPADDPMQVVTQSKNQLPPLVQVTMVAIDAPSALRLANRYGVNPPPLYANAPFADVLMYDKDMAALQTTLQGLQLNYRVFVSDVSLPGAKWSQAQ